MARRGRILLFQDLEGIVGEINPFDELRAGPE